MFRVITTKPICRFLFLLTLSLIFLGDSPLAEAKEADHLAAGLQQRYLSVKSIQFSFEQQALNNGRLRRGSGVGVFLRHSGPMANEDRSSWPTTMRWDYLSPSKQIILNSGRTLSIYTEDDKQLIITSADELESDITYALFSGKMNLKDVFLISPVADRTDQSLPEDKLDSLILIPLEPHPQLQRLQLWLTDDFLIKKLAMEDHFGSTTTIVLSDTRVNSIDPEDATQVEAILDLDLPADTEIIRQ